MVAKLLNPAVSACRAQPGIMAGSTFRIWLGSPIPIFIAWHFRSVVCEFNAPNSQPDRTGYSGCHHAQNAGLRPHFDQVSCGGGIPDDRSGRSLDDVTGLSVGRTERSASWIA